MRNLIGKNDHIDFIHKVILKYHQEYKYEEVVVEDFEYQIKDNSIYIQYRYKNIDEDFIYEEYLSFTNLELIIILNK